MAATAGAGLGSRRAVAGPTRSPALRAVELTFLKSLPGQRENLERFIVRNWFAMDRVAKEQHIISAYTMLSTGRDEGPWNVLVQVTYPDERGYEGIAAAFETIRRAHRMVPVDGKTLAQLGTIVDAQKLFENRAVG